MNNIFSYATKELSQDAFLCWSINWLSEGENAPLYQYGKCMLDMLLGDKKFARYLNVEVRNQYEKIDVLVLFKDEEGTPNALIIEDKTNTSEHGEQLSRYRDKLIEKIPAEESMREYKDLEKQNIHLAYIKAGIMYDNDWRMVGKGATVIDLDALLNIVSEFAESSESEILTSFYAHILNLKKERLDVEKQIKEGEYEKALQTRYGQFYFLDNIFDRRSKGKIIGNKYVEHDPNSSVCIDEIYAGTNRGGTPWTQYCFWGNKYLKQYNDKGENEYHYLFWRVDCKGGKPYIALRHYDSWAHSGDNEHARKQESYRKFYKLTEDSRIKKFKMYFSPFNKSENYKESDLIFIEFEKIKHLPFNEIKKMFTEITEVFESD